MEESGSRRRLIRGFGDDVLLRIFAHLTLRSLAQCAVVCKYWNKLIESSSLLWRTMYTKNYKTLKATVGLTFMSKIAKLSLPRSNNETVTDWKSRAVQEEQCAQLLSGSISIQPWKAHRGRVNCCRMMMDYIASGSSDRKIRIWSSKSRHYMEEYTLPTSAAIVDLDFDTNKILGIAGAELYIWRRDGKRRLLRQMGGHNQRLYSMCHVDPEVSVGCEDGAIRIFDLYGGGCSSIIRQHTEAVTGVGVNADLHLLASCSRDGTVKLCDSFSGEKVASLSSKSSLAEAHCLQVISDGLNKLVVGTASGHLHCWDMRMHHLLWKSKVSNGAITSVHHQPYGASILCVGGFDGIIRVVDCTSGHILSAFGCRKNVHYNHTSISKSPSVITKAPKEGFTKLGSEVLATSGSQSARDSLLKDSFNVTRCLPPQLAHRLSDDFASGMLNRNDPPILSVRLGMTKLVSSHPDGTLALWEFGL
ncbi:hypothetical protein O6H91_20G015100 [Diphasiastrum complanatum]|uniref:Uncharacterized protein n=1 Tax=Diphasiastrum complanatum TaxID=34168 RepID=A0ACC2AMV8_DIPCM|nr:hypothetical protein O6H91_20G015100 [Diphasiastrum complanatum]